MPRSPVGPIRFIELTLICVKDPTRPFRQARQTTHTTTHNVATTFIPRTHLAKVVCGRTEDQRAISGMSLLSKRRGYDPASPVAFEPLEIWVDDGRTRIEMTNEEARRLASALAVGYEGMSWAEYFIRSGLSEPTIRQFVSALWEMLDAGGGGMSLEVPGGIEAVENPRRPRPARPDST
jgi:hypothetical protein